MLVNPTVEKLHAMRLRAMAEAFTEQLSDPEMAQLSFEERFALLVDRQWTWRENRALERRLKNARLKLSACLEDVNYRRPRGLDRSLIASLATCRWIQTHHNLLIIGPCGVGKTFLACAFAQKAARLFRDLALARADGSLDKLLRKIARTDVLIVDDWAMNPLAESERRDFYEICEDRYDSRSTILTSQLPVAHWHEQIGDPTTADSILDRLVHNAYRIELEGASMRRHRHPPTKAKDES